MLLLWSIYFSAIIPDLDERVVNVPAMSQNKRTIKSFESVDDKLAALS